MHANFLEGLRAEAGKELARLHLDYEKLEPYELKFAWADPSLARAAGSKPISYRVEKMS
jgi:predicted helicase